MANFNTHLNAAIISSGLASATLLSATHIDFNSALWLWFLGTVGGLLPDIDSDNSTSLDSIFAMFTLTVVLIVIRYINEGLFKESQFIELVAVPLLIYGIMKYVIRPLFEKSTIHRGSCHSIAFILLCALLATQITWRLSYNHTQQPDIIAWFSGGFVFLGGFVHLLLDEIYSVDLRNVRIKRSFGTAMKLVQISWWNGMITFVLRDSAILNISDALILSVIPLGFSPNDPRATSILWSFPCLAK